MKLDQFCRLTQSTLVCNRPTRHQVIIFYLYSHFTVVSAEQTEWHASHLHRTLATAVSARGHALVRHCREISGRYMACVERAGIDKMAVSSAR